MTNLNVIFHVVVSVYRLVKIWNSPQFPAEFRNGLLFDILAVFAVYWARKSGVYVNRNRKYHVSPNTSRNHGYKMA